jgi:outer membrane lipoprotein carrier protein
MAVVSLLRQFEAKYHHTNSLRASFLERYRENGRLVRVETGEAYFLRPGKMRWDYQSPEKNTFLVDGKYVWFYSPQDHTATRMPAKQSDDWRTPLAFLTSHRRLTQICANTVPAPGAAAAEANGTVFKCSLRGARNEDGAASAPILFEVSPEGALNRIVFPQEGGIELEFVFKNWQWNPALDKRVFDFVAPRDAVIVDGLLPETPGLRQ